MALPSRGEAEGATGRSAEPDPPGSMLACGAETQAANRPLSHEAVGWSDILESPLRSGVQRMDAQSVGLRLEDKLVPDFKGQSTSGGSDRWATRCRAACTCSRPIRRAQRACRWTHPVHGGGRARRKRSPARKASAGAQEASFGGSLLHGQHNRVLRQVL